MRPFLDHALGITRGNQIFQDSFLKGFQLYFPNSFPRYECFSWFLSSIGHVRIKFPSTPSSRNLICIFLIIFLNILSFPDSCPHYTPWQSNFPSLPSSRRFSCIFLILVLNMTRENQLFQALLLQEFLALYPWFLSSIYCFFWFLPPVFTERIKFSKPSLLKKFQLYFFLFLTSL